MMKIRDIKDTGDLKEMTVNDVADLLDELRGIAQQRGTEWLARGRVEARRAIGAPGEGAVGAAFLIGILVGAATAAVATLLFSPVPAPEARRKLTERVEKVRERVPAMDGNGKVGYERSEPGTVSGGTPTA